MISETAGVRSSVCVVVVVRMKVTSSIHVVDSFCHCHCVSKMARSLAPRRTYYKVHADSSCALRVACSGAGGRAVGSLPDFVCMNAKKSEISQQNYPDCPADFPCRGAHISADLSTKYARFSQADFLMTRFPDHQISPKADF